jgi:uncharacterized protein YbjT (DUF2867 family)
MRILLTGATGFVGSQLLTELLDLGHQVVCLARNNACVQRLAEFPVEIIAGDARETGVIEKAVAGCDAAYYLIHSMASDGDFRDNDRAIAKNFARVAGEQNLQRVIYVSGLANEDDPKLSKHLASRVEVGKILRGGAAPCIEFRAAMIIGDESISFRMVKHLCHRLPIMLCPKWLSTVTQPLAASDLIQYLVQALTLEPFHSQVVEIGGHDQATYKDILQTYCNQMNLKRIMIPVPFLTPKLSSYWLALVTPETAEVGRRMIDGLRNPTFVQNDAASRLFDIQPKSISQAIADAIAEQKAN